MFLRGETALQADCGECNPLRVHQFMSELIQKNITLGFKTTATIITASYFNPGNIGYSMGREYIRPFVSPECSISVQTEEGETMMLSVPKEFFDACGKLGETLRITVEKV